jgi:hypothetical protein
VTINVPKSFIDVSISLFLSKPVSAGLTYSQSLLRYMGCFTTKMFPELQDVPELNPEDAGKVWGVNEDGDGWELIDPSVPVRAQCYQCRGSAAFSGSGGISPAYEPDIALNSRNSSGNWFYDGYFDIHADIWKIESDVQIHLSTIYYQATFRNQSDPTLIPLPPYSIVPIVPADGVYFLAPTFIVSGSTIYLQFHFETFSADAAFGSFQIFFKGSVQEEESGGD